MLVQVVPELELPVLLEPVLLEPVLLEPVLLEPVELDDEVELLAPPVPLPPPVPG